MEAVEDTGAQERSNWDRLTEAGWEEPSEQNLQRFHDDISLSAAFPAPPSASIPDSPSAGPVAPPGFGSSSHLQPPPDARLASARSTEVPSQRQPPAHPRQLRPSAQGPQKLSSAPVVGWPMQAQAAQSKDLEDVMTLLGVSLPTTSAAAPAREPWEQPVAAPSYLSKLAASPEEEAPRDEDDEELQKALQASLVDTRAPPTPAILSTHTHANGQVSVVATPGLQNNAGEYNCFLNCIIQCLWHCEEFRRHVQNWSRGQIQENAVVVALVDLFQTFADEEMHASGGAKGVGRRQVVTAHELRKALHERSEEQFALGEMSDAAEVLNAIYDNLALVADGGALVERLFTWRVHQFVRCNVCDHLSHDTRHEQTIYQTLATALREEAAADHLTADGGDNATLSALLARVEEQVKKSCDTDTGGCGVKCQVKQALQQGSMPARIFTLQLGWERAQEPAEAIRSAMATISEEIDVAQVFIGGRRPFLYGLRCLICYYGLHYFAFVKDRKSGSWRMFDDAVTSEIGDWQAVQRKCYLGKIQPSVLFYEAKWKPIA